MSADGIFPSFSRASTYLAQNSRGAAKDSSSTPWLMRLGNFQPRPSAVATFCRRSAAERSLRQIYVVAYGIRITTPSAPAEEASRHYSYSRPYFVHRFKLRHYRQVWS